MITTRMMIEGDPLIIDVTRTRRGVGLTGLTISLTIQRASDSKYWDGDSWESGVQTLTMTENGFGAYSYTISATTGTNYLCHAFISSGDNAFDLFETVMARPLAQVGSQVSLSTVAQDALVDKVWDEPLTGATHNIQTSAGRRLRQVAAQIVIDGTAVGAGANGNQIILDTDASTMNGAYDPALIAIVNGTGSGQCRLILEYTGATRTATVDRTWKVNPDATSEYVIYAHPGREHVNEGLARGGDATHITLNANASSVNGEYIGQLVFLRSGTGEDQCRLVIGYDGATKIATVDHAWSINPDTTTGYVMLPNHIHETVVLDANQPHYAPIKMDTAVETQTVEYALRSMMAMFNGNFSYDSNAKIIIFYDRGGNEFSRVSVPDEVTRTRIS